MCVKCVKLASNDLYCSLVYLNGHIGLFLDLNQNFSLWDFLFKLLALRQFKGLSGEHVYIRQSEAFKTVFLVEVQKLRCHIGSGIETLSNEIESCFLKWLMSRDHP